MKKILIINANYYTEISDYLVNSAKKFLKNKKYKVSVVKAPGIFEIPFTIRKNIKKFDAYVAVGCVIKGETPHFDLICKSTFESILYLSITYKKPIGNGIITAFTMKQARKRCGKEKSNKPNKGIEAANAVVSVLSNGPKKI